jgi:hypothetical protein
VALETGRRKSVRQHGLRRLTVRHDNAQYQPHPLTEVIMRSVTLTVPDNQKFEFGDNLDAWERASGYDARVTLGDQFPKTTALGSPIVYIVQIDDSFFDQYPK